MIAFSWNIEKNHLLKADASRGISFDDIVFAIESGGLLDDIAHSIKPNIHIKGF